jgi:hypothetical protein
MPLLIVYGRVMAKKRMKDVVLCMHCKTGSTLSSKIPPEDFFSLHKDQHKFQDCHAYYSEIQKLYEKIEVPEQENTIVDQDANYVIRQLTEKMENESKESIREAYDSMISYEKKVPYFIARAENNVKIQYKKEITEMEQEYQELLRENNLLRERLEEVSERCKLAEAIQNEYVNCKAKLNTIMLEMSASKKQVTLPDSPPTPGKWYSGNAETVKDDAVKGRELYDSLTWRIQNNDDPEDHKSYYDENVDVENYIEEYNNMSMKLLYNLYKDWLQNFITHDDLLTELEYMDYEPNK